MGRWNGHVCEFISSLVASFSCQTWQNSRASALLPFCLEPLDTAAATVLPPGSLEQINKRLTAPYVKAKE
jgi:hypothetical protein